MFSIDGAMKTVDKVIERKTEEFIMKGSHPKIFERYVNSSEGISEKMLSCYQANIDAQRLQAAAARLENAEKDGKTMAALHDEVNEVNKNLSEMEKSMKLIKDKASRAEENEITASSCLDQLQTICQGISKLEFSRNQRRLDDCFSDFEKEISL